jgi:anti-sigma factor RsiW
MGPHVEDRFEALLSGELSAEEAGRVQAHCDACPECGRALAEAQRAWEALGEAEAPVQPPSLWPRLEARLAPRRSPRVRLTFALGASAAALAGLVLGVYLGSQFLGDSNTWQQETWSQVGSLIADGGQGSLDQVYVTGFEEEEESP